MQLTMQTKKKLSVSLCLILAGLLFAFPSYVILNSPMPSAGYYVEESVSYANPYDITASSITGEYTVNMSEDQPVSFSLDGYLHLGWNSIETSDSYYVMSDVSGEYLNLVPQANWFGSEEISVTAYYDDNSINPPRSDDRLMSADGEQENYTVVFNVNVLSVNDPPVSKDTPKFLFKTTTATEFEFPNPFDLGMLFEDIDSSLAYSWSCLNDLVSISIEDQYITSMNAGLQAGDDTVIITATDGEYSTTTDIQFQILTKEMIPMLEDNAAVMTTDADYNPDDYEILTYNSEHVAIAMDGPDCHLFPAENWYGYESVGIYTRPILPSTNPPPPGMSISSTPPGNSISPPETEYVEYSYIEYLAAVSPVNDEPVVNSDAQYTLTMTADSELVFYSPVNLDNVFTDIDSELTYSWGSENGFSYPVMDRDKIYSLNTRPHTGTDILTFYAFDGEYVASIDLNVQVVPRNSLEMSEDNDMELALNEYVEPSEENFYFESADHISVKKHVAKSGSVSGILTPSPDWFGQESVTLITETLGYSLNPPSIIKSQDSLSSTQEVYYGYYEFDVAVAGVNDPPTLEVSYAPVEINEDQWVTGVLNLQDCFSDIDSELEFSVSSSTDMITPTLSSDGSLNIYPGQDWFGTGEIILSATDGEYTVSYDLGVNVIPVNDIPMASEGIAVVDSLEDTDITLALDSYIVDIDSALWYSCEYDSRNLTAEINETTWEAVFMPEENWNGETTLTIYGSDGEYEIAKIVELHIAPVNDAPVAKPMDHQEFNEDLGLDIAMSDMFEDIDSSLFYRARSLSGKLNCVLTDDTLHISSSQENWNGFENVIVTAFDGEFSETLELEITVSPVNDAPRARSDICYYSMKEDSELLIPVDNMFEDIDGDMLAFSFTSESDAVLELSAGTLRVVPPENMNGEISLTILASDGSANAASQLLIDVKAVNDPPLAASSGMLISGTAGDTILIDLSDYFSDTDSSDLTFGISGNTDVLVSETDMPGVYEITIPDGWEGSEALSLSASDGYETVESQIYVSSAMAGAPVEVSASTSPLQSLFWLGTGILVTIASMALINTSSTRRKRNRIPAGRDSIL